MKTILAASFAALLGTAAFAVEVPDGCTDNFQQVIDGLAGGWGEVIAARGIGADGLLYTTFANATTGSWTVITTTPEGISCVENAGSTWEAVQPEPNV